eukprot:1702095-Pyramimonas_sp.AAC.1
MHEFDYLLPDWLARSEILVTSLCKSLGYVMAWIFKKCPSPIGRWNLLNLFPLPPFSLTGAGLIWHQTFLGLGGWA